MLGWAAPHREPLRNTLAHPKLVGAMTDLMGAGYRLDHSPLLLGMEKGSAGHTLHGGASGSYVLQAHSRDAQGVKECSTVIKLDMADAVREELQSFQLIMQPLGAAAAVAGTVEVLCSIPSGSVRRLSVSVCLGVRARQDLRRALPEDTARHSIIDLYDASAYGARHELPHARFAFVELAAARLGKGQRLSEVLEDAPFFRCGVKGKSQRMPAPQSTRLHASAQLRCSAAQCRHKAGKSTNPLPRARHRRGAGKRGTSTGCSIAGSRSRGLPCIACCTKSAGDGAPTAAVGA